jgi:ATP-dependent Zn protease
VNLPDKVGREAILEVHTRSVPLAKSVDLEELAASTPGLSGADLRNLVNEAALLAARREQEEVVYGTRTTGAESDIEQATDLARRMVTRWGMSEKLGTVELAPRDNPYLGGSGGYGGEKPYSEETARTIDAEVWRIIDESYLDARRLLTEHRKELEALAQALLERETLDEQEILEVTELAPAPPLENKKIAATSSNFRRDGR